MPSVRIEDDAFGDLRYETLAEVAGLADADHARGKMIRLWRQCTAERIYHLSETEVCAVLGPRGVDALIRSRLGEQTERGIRIRGTKGRIEWLEKLRKNGSKGGRPRKAVQQTKQKPSGFRESNPLAPALVTAPALSDPDISRTAREAVAGAPGQPDPVPGDASTPTIDRSGDSILALLAEAASELNSERIKLDPTAHRIDDTTAGQLTRRLTATPAADRRRRLLHAVACVVAKARRTREVSGLRWSTFASEDAWAYVQDSTVADYAAGSSRPGHGARDSPPRQQVQQRRTPIRDLTAPKRADP